MPPHCDSMDGPVVTAARLALADRDVRRVLPYVKKAGEAEVVAAFDRAVAVRNGSPSINEVADLYFFDTVVRVHRAGEGAPYTGLKPAGLPVGPVIPVAERAIEAGDARELVELLVDTLTHEVEHRFAVLLERREHAADGVDEAREYVEAMLGIEVWSHQLYGSIKGGAGHGQSESEAQGHG